MWCQRVELVGNRSLSCGGCDPMTTVLLRNWWALALRGVLAILLGVAVAVLPGITLSALVGLFGAYALVAGGLAIIAGGRAAERHERWWSPILNGHAGMADRR